MQKACRTARNWFGARPKISPVHGTGCAETWLAKNSRTKPAKVARRNPRISKLLELLFAFCEGQTGIDPIGAEIIGDVDDLHVGKSHGMELVIGRLGVRAFVPRAATAIDDDELLVLQGRNPLPQQFQPLGL